MTVGGPGRLLPAGGGEDGRFPEGAPGVQQEQLQQVPCGFRLQGFQPPALGVFAHQRIPLGTDYRDREDKHPPALPPPAVGQKECGQEAGAGAGRAGGRELGPAAQNRPDRQPGHDRGHLKKTKTWEFGNSPGSSRFFFASPDPLGIPRTRPIYLGFAWFLVCIYGVFMEGGGGFVRPWGSSFPEFLVFLGYPRVSHSPEFLLFFLGWPRIPDSPNSPFSLRFLGFAPQISQEGSFPKIPLFLGFIPFLKFPFPWDSLDLLLVKSQINPFFFCFPPKFHFFWGDSWDPPQNSPFPNPHFFWDLLPSQKSFPPSIPHIPSL